MNKREKLRQQMIENAAEINRLRLRADEMAEKSSESEDACQEWHRAAKEFHDRYGYLCIPGGWDAGFMNRFRAGDHNAVEAALCFLEVRPYFFRSGYMLKDLLQKCKRVPMNEEQSSRFLALLQRYSEWIVNREAKAKRGMRVRNGLSTLFIRFERLFPVTIWDSELEEVTTVGSLYGLLCRDLKLEPLEHPKTNDGKARKPYSPGKFLKFPRYQLPYSEMHGRSAWNAGDVWATLVATIREVYALGPEFAITTETELPIQR